MDKALGALAAGLLSAAAAAAQAAPPQPLEGLAAFLESVQNSAPRLPQRYGAQLPRIESGDGRRSVAPTLDLVAGRLDADHCLYQLRLELHWSGSSPDDDDDRVGGRSLIQKAPCATLVQEVVAVAQYELSALQRRLQGAGRLALNRERDQVIAAVRRAPAPAAQGLYVAVTVDDRVNVRVSPSLKAPVLSKLSPASVVEVAPTASADWYRLPSSSGYVHASALRTLEPAPALAPPQAPAAAVVEAVVGSAHLPVHQEPSPRSRVVARLKPRSAVRLLPTPVPGWLELDDGAGFVPEAGVQRGAPVLVSGGAAVRSAP